MSVINIIDEAQFEENVLKSDKPVLVDFWASWCSPCKMIAPEIEAVAQNFEGKAVITKVNIDEQKNLAGKYRVMSIPTLLVFKDGSEVERISGFRPRKDIGDTLEKFI